MKNLDKQQIAVFLLIGLVVVGMILYSVSTLSGNDQDKAEQEQEIAFEAPKDPIESRKKKYKSTLEVYEQKHLEEEEAKKPVQLDFQAFPEQDIEASKEQMKVQPDQVPTDQRPVKNISTSSRVKRISTEKPKDIPLTDSESEPDATTTTKKVKTKARGLVTARNLNTEINISEHSTPHSIPVVTHGDQTLRNNRPIKLRITKDVTINSIPIKAGTVIPGTVSFSNDRVFISVSQFTYDGELIRTDLEAYDNGQRGIYAPASVDKEIAANTAQSAGSGIRVTLPVIGGSISSTGLNKKINASEKEVFIPSQHKLLLSYK